MPPSLQPQSSVLSPQSSRPESFVGCAYCHVPVAVAIARHLDLPRLTTDRAVLHELLPAPAFILEVEVRNADSALCPLSGKKMQRKIATVTGDLIGKVEEKVGDVQATVRRISQS